MTKIIFIFVIIILGLGYLCFVKNRFAPKKAENRSCSVVDGGECIKINKFDLWVKVIESKEDSLPYYVIPGGMGMKSKYLEESFKFISKTNTVIFYDPRGCGRSESKEELNNYLWQDFSNELFQLIKKITPNRKIGLVAHSCGSALLYKFLSEHKDLVEKVILISSMLTKYECKPPNILSILKQYPPKNPFEANKWFSKYIRGEVGFATMFYKKENLHKLDTENTSMIMMTMLNGIINKPYDYTNELFDYDKPVLILCGRDEFEASSTNRKCADKIKSVFKNSTIKIFDKSGHFPLIEEANEFENVVTKFIS